MYKLIKHRGISNDTIKENTYDAIKMALDDKRYVGVEFDVRETRDGEFIIYHDPMYNGKLISEYLYNELPKFMPKLKMILQIKSNKMFLVELKNINHIEKLITLLKKYNNKKIYVMSFSNSLIDKINIKDRNYKIGVLNYVLNTNKDTKKLDFICILNSLLNDDIINLLKDLEIFSYGIFEKMKYDNIYYITDK